MILGVLPDHVAITRKDVSAADLRHAAARTQDSKVARRMLAIALVLEGCSRTEAAEAYAMERQTLRDRVHRFNASGLYGLSDQPRRNGPLPRLSAAQQAEIEAWVASMTSLSRPAQASRALRPAGLLNRPTAAFATRLRPTRLPR